MKLKLIIRKSNKKNRTEAATTIHICNGYSQARYLFQLTATMITLVASIDKKNPSYHLKSTPLIAMREVSNSREELKSERRIKEKP